MKIIRIIISVIFFIPIVLGFGWQFGIIWQSFSFTGTQLWFWISFAIAALIFLIFLKQSAYMSILKHELIHNLFALLTFRKPEGIHVNRGKGGEFRYSGSSNPLIILSPYFFPLISFFFMIIFLFGLKQTNVFFLLFGVAAAFDMISSFKDTHLKQTDLTKYGLFFSLLFVMVFWIVNWGIIFDFVMHGGFLQVDDYVVEGFKKVYNLYRFLYQKCCSF